MTLWLATFLAMFCTAMDFTIAVFCATNQHPYAAFIFLVATVVTLGILGCLAAMRDVKVQLKVIPPYPVFASGVPEQHSRMRL